MTKNIILALLTTIATLGIISCNTNTYEGPIDTYSNVAVTSFSLNENDKILENLDSVYFSIDLPNALIYNADSLPYGTKTSKLTVSIVTAETCAKVELINLAINDTINYLENSTDSVDFSQGPIVLRVVSADLSNERKYSVNVNVHLTKPDSLSWGRLANSGLPSSLERTSIDEQKTIEYNGNAVCLTRDNDKYCIATTENPGNDNWEKQIIEFPFTPNVKSFVATSEALFILDTTGNLYTSVDGNAWTSCDQQWSHIYGGYENTLLGVKSVDGRYYHATYPTSTETEVAADCPVSGTSQMLVFDNSWSTSPQALMIGGKCANGRLTGSTWAYDGSQWAKISNTPVPALQNMTFFPYFCFKQNSDNWNFTKYSTLIAMCGQNEYSKAINTVYISFDQGMNWKKADDLMQLPNIIPARQNAQALVYNSTIHSRSTNTWHEYNLTSLPKGWAIVNTFSSRATTEVSEWECPYIYLFGGEDSEGKTYNTVWRGVINRLSFKPII